MFEPLLKAARDLADASWPLSEASEILLLQAVPDGLSLDDIDRLAAEIPDGPDTTAVLSAVYASLKSDKLGNGPGKDRERGSEDVLGGIALRIGKAIEPVCSGATFDEDSTDYAALSRNGLLGLRILSQLIALAPRGGLVFPARTLLSVVAFTDRHDPWTSDSCAQLARSLLSHAFGGTTPLPHLPRDAEAGREKSPIEKRTAASASDQAAFITEDVLTGFLRPLFAKSRPTTVTASGRPAAFPEPPPRYSQGDGFGGGGDVTAAKPWKYARRYAVTVFAWAVENADTDLLQRNWHLYTPILLTLLDEPQPTSLKLRSLSIFRAFRRLCPEGLLSRTGLADVFEQAVFPTVLSLPSLTPEAESLSLLSAAYPALFDMAGIEDVDSTAANDRNEGFESEITNHKVASDRPNIPSGGFTEAQRKLLDKIVRDGIMVGYHHAKGHIRLVDFFCQTMCHLVDAVGILSVKYLKDMIPMISEILVDPFGTKYPPALLSAIRLLRAVLQSCWPRVPHYCNEIIKIAMVSWLNIEDDEEPFPPNNPTKSELKQELTSIIEMLSAITVAAKIDLSDRVCPLVAKDPQLRPLFASCEAKQGH
ncbi:hypothetical protein F5Y14DRAFT_445539 [Nemania sp. NC0429]|nr:hypothetical protein F5Y14DRAFT_445539 [Nemania sp. NC0429]